MTKLKTMNITVLMNISIKSLGIISVGFDLTDQLLIRILHSSGTGKKCEYNETVHQLLVDFKKAYDSVRREVLYNTLIEFRVPMKLVGRIKMCLNKTYKIRISKYLYVSSPIQNGLKQGCALSPLFFNFASEYAIRNVQKT
jgi:hypothetical protein